MNRGEMINTIETAIDIVKGLDKSPEPLFYTPKFKDITEEQKQKDEFKCLGFFVSSHPLDIYKGKLEQMTSLSALTMMDQGSNIAVGGLMLNPTVKVTKKGTKMAFFHLEDLSSRVEVVVFPNVYKKFTHLFQDEMKVIQVNGKVEHQVREFDGEEMVFTKIIAFDISELENAQRIERVKLQTIDNTNFSKISEIIFENPGDMEIEINYKNFKTKIRQKVNQERKVLAELEKLCNIEYCYEEKAA
jgi:DNA polymerase III subunit alpha